MVVAACCPTGHELVSSSAKSMFSYILEHTKRGSQEVKSRAGSDDGWKWEF
jgi:hypothetical protein